MACLEPADPGSPKEATQLVLADHPPTTGGDAWEGTAGELMAIPPAQHALAAVERSAILLTVRLSS